MFYHWEVKDSANNGKPNVLHLFIKVQAKASKDEFAEIISDGINDRIKLRITALPIDGKANKHLIKFLAKLFGVPKSNIQIKSGETSHNKHLIISNPQRLPPQITE